jgi:hypothetical protein
VRQALGGWGSVAERRPARRRLVFGRRRLQEQGSLCLGSEGDVRGPF